MSKKLPTRGFKWMNSKELEEWRELSWILEVDLKYSKNLHTLHNDYSLAPEKNKTVKFCRDKTNSKLK